MAILLSYLRTVNPYVTSAELIARLKPIVGPEIEITMQTEGQRIELRGFKRGRKQGLDQGRKQGFDQGRKQGFDKGQAHGQRDILLRQLTRRFGRLPEAAVHRVSNAGPDELMRWSDRVLDAETLDDVLAVS